MSFLQFIPALRKFPEVNFNFVVMAGLDMFGEFQSVTEISYEHEPYEIKEGGRNFSSRLRPFAGPSKRGRVKLAWGNLAWDSMSNWMESVDIGMEFRRQVFVLQLGRAGWPTRIFRFGGAWPVAWKAADLDTKTSDWAVDELTLAYETFNSISIPITVGQ